MVICCPSSYLFAKNTEFQTAPIGPFLLLFVYSRVTAHLWFVSVTLFCRFPCGRAPGRLFALFRTVYKIERTRYLRIPSQGLFLFFWHVILCYVMFQKLNYFFRCRTMQKFCVRPSGKMIDRY